MSVVLITWIQVYSFVNFSTYSIFQGEAHNLEKGGQKAEIMGIILDYRYT